VGVFNFKLPDVGEGTAEAEITAWHVKVGDTVAEDQPLVDVMTDKATVEITSPVGGVVQEINGAPGAMAPVGSIIVVLEVEGAGNVKAGASPPAASAAPPPAAPDPVAPKPPTVSGAPATGELRGPGGGAVAQTHSPLTRSSRPPRPRNTPSRPARPATSRWPRRRCASARATWASSSSSFRAPAPPAASATRTWTPTSPTPRPRRGGGGTSPLYAQRTAVEDVKIIGLRRKIAEKMQEAKRRIPHFMYAEEIDATELEALRLHLNADQEAGPAQADPAALLRPRPGQGPARAPADQRHLRRRQRRPAPPRRRPLRHRHPDARTA
jgi:2-oxoisovalerate dehydrogenase E2 component (dihydrolipoyl transacylase)